MGLIKEVIVDGEKIYLKKDFLGWHTVNPIQKDITKKIGGDGKINWDNIHWKNLITGGSWFKLLIVTVLILILLGAMFEVAGIVRTANECLQRQDILSNLSYSLGYGS